MNLFFLSPWLEENAHFVCDSHCVKMILETCQMLYTAWHLSWQGNVPELEPLPYRATHKNHPTTKWVRACKENYDYACYYGLLLCAEYTSRYKKYHKTELHLRRLKSWGYPTTLPQEGEIMNPLRCAFKDIPFGIGWIPLCMPDHYYVRDKEGKLLGISSYQNFYANKPIKMLWKYTSPPKFIETCKKQEIENE